MTELQKLLQAQLVTLNAEIVKQKALDKLQKCRVNIRTMHKYTEYQRAYAEACKEQ